MDAFFSGLGAPMMLLIGAFVGITALLWFLLPFSVFGIKARLDEQLRILRQIDDRLAALPHALAQQRQESAAAVPAAEGDTPAEAVEAASERAPTHRTDRPTRPPASEHDERWQRRG